MKILGIETSCDETAAAIVEKIDENIKVLSSNVASSEELHKKTGGIIPEVAARKQVESIIAVIDQTLKDANLAMEDIDAIAVTYGPGLIGSLLVGVEAAKSLSMVYKKPLIPVNHLHGHLFVNWLADEKPQLPALGLVVSGGHTDFVIIKEDLGIEYIGGTRDDAAGEAFDKTARLIGLSYPGGPAISKMATEYINNNPDKKLELFPRPMIDSGDVDMSFSGLKTTVLNFTKQNQDYDQSEIAANIQEAIIDTLVFKTKFALEKYKPQSFVLSGGVSANSRLKEKMQNMLRSMSELLPFYVPQPQNSTDNAIMIAVAAVLKNNPIGWQDLSANPSLSIED